MIIKFHFSLFETAVIKGIGATGFVSYILVNKNGDHEYKVIYWLDGTRKEDWFFPFELNKKGSQP